MNRPVRSFFILISGMLWADFVVANGNMFFPSAGPVGQMNYPNYYPMPQSPYGSMPMSMSMPMMPEMYQIPQPPSRDEQAARIIHYFNNRGAIPFGAGAIMPPIGGVFLENRRMQTQILNDLYGVDPLHPHQEDDSRSAY